jgi:hypothetical protein
MAQLHKHGIETLYGMRKLPERFVPNRYSCSVHGVGLADEYPYIYHPQDNEKVGYDSHFPENMLVCLWSLTLAVLGRKKA